jgi:iron complex transport system ATP-binding protein
MIITAKNISFSPGNKPILHNLSFVMQPGEVEQSATAGTVLINDKDITSLSLSHLARCRAVLSQQYMLNLPFSCEEIVMMGRYPHFNNRAATVDHNIVQQCMQEMQVAQFTCRLYQTLSGGEQQRVQMARVLAQLHEVNAADENGNCCCLMSQRPVSIACINRLVCKRRASWQGMDIP